MEIYIDATSKTLKETKLKDTKEYDCEEMEVNTISTICSSFIYEIKYSVINEIFFIKVVGKIRKIIFVKFFNK